MLKKQQKVPRPIFQNYLYLLTKELNQHCDCATKMYDDQHFWRENMPVV